jgi:hypothetical protein
VVILQRFLGHIGLERIMGVGQIGEREGHGQFSAVLSRGHPNQRQIAALVAQPSEA